jgi:hypothetical protein
MRPKEFLPGVGKFLATTFLLAGDVFRGVFVNAFK